MRNTKIWTTNFNCYSPTIGCQFLSGSFNDVNDEMIIHGIYHRVRLKCKRTNIYEWKIGDVKIGAVMEPVDKLDLSSKSLVTIRVGQS